MPLYRSISLASGISMEFRRIIDRGEVGEFWRGSRGEYDEEEPRHRVRLTVPYYLGVTPVTQAQYRAMASECLEDLSRLSANKGVEPSHFEGDERPVENVD